MGFLLHFKKTISIIQAMNDAIKIPINKCFTPNIKLIAMNNLISPYPNISFFNILSKNIVISNINIETINATFLS